MADNEILTETQFIDRFVAHCIVRSGVTHFDDGAPVADYAREVAAICWRDLGRRADGPEACAEADMDYWGEE